MKKGFVQVYTGDGKGKTTAAIGLAVRAAGAGLRVFIGQFAKGRTCSEHRALGRFRGLITVRHFGRTGFVVGAPSRADITAAARCLSACAAALRCGRYDIVVLDEANAAVECGMIGVDRLVSALRDRHPGTEAVVTGRNAHRRILGMADLVTEMRDIKHYYRKGVMSRKGIEE